MFIRVKSLKFFLLIITSIVFSIVVGAVGTYVFFIYLVEHNREARIDLIDYLTEIEQKQFPSNVK